MYEAIRNKLRNKFTEHTAFFIYPLNVPSSKNNKEVVNLHLLISVCCNATIISKKPDICSKCGKECLRRGKTLLVNSKRVQNYVKETEKSYLGIKKELQQLMMDQPPVFIGYYFIRDSERIWDFINGAQIICDLLTEYKIITDDNTKIIIPVYLGEHVAPKPVDKNKERTAGVIITILKKEDYLKSILNCI